MKLSALARQLVLSVAYRRLGLTAQVSQLGLDVVYRRLGLTAQLVSQEPQKFWIEDFVALSDLLDRVMNWGPFLQDAVNTQEGLTRGLIKALNDDQGLEDLVALAYDARYNEAAAVSDAVALVLTFQRDFAEMSSAADGLIRTVGKTLADTLLSSDASVLSLLTAVSDTAAQNDNLLYTIGKVLGDTTTVTDIVNLIASYPRTFTDNQTTSDALSGWDMSRGLSDAATQGDALAWTGTKPLTDSSTPNDVVALTLTFIREFVESVLATDLVTQTLNGAATQNPTDATAPSDATNFAVEKTQTDTTSILDTLLVSVGWNVALSDATNAVVDSLVLAVTQAISDAVSAQDALTSINTNAVRQDVVDAVAFDPSKAFGTLTSDTISAPTDAVTDFAVGKGLSDAAAPADSPTTFGLTSALADTPFADDKPALATERPLTDTATLIDAAAQTFIAALNDTVASILSDATRTIEKAFAESAVALADGSWRMQDYVDPTYLAEDYVITTGTFT